MNCKNVQELLPLYVSRDLEENRTRLVSAHVQSCAECSGLAGEYHETSKLMQGFAPPDFSEAVYSGIRQRVLREIEPQASDSSRAPLTRLFGGLFQPRIGWAVAAAMLLAVGLFAFYSIANRDSGEKLQAEVSPQKPEPPKSSSPIAPPSGEDKRVVKATSPETSGVRRRVGSAVVRGPSLASNRRPKREIRNEAALQSNKITEPNTDQPLERVLRLEMQTKDPNVRIIWLTPQRPKQDSPNKIS